jgi:hypothetical protein
VDICAAGVGWGDSSRDVAGRLGDLGCVPFRDSTTQRLVDTDACSCVHRGSDGYHVPCFGGKPHVSDGAAFDGGAVVLFSGRVHPKDTATDANHSVAIFCLDLQAAAFSERVAAVDRGGCLSCGEYTKPTQFGLQALASHHAVFVGFITGHF